MNLMNLCLCLQEAKRVEEEPKSKDELALQNAAEAQYFEAFIKRLNLVQQLQLE